MTTEKVIQKTLELAQSELQNYKRDNPIKLRNEKYDAYYDSDTGEWLEDKCNDPECKFCKDRPDNAFNLTQTHPQDT